HDLLPPAILAATTRDPISTGAVPSEPQLARDIFRPTPAVRGAGAWPESAIVAVGCVRTFSSNISLISSPNLSSHRRTKETTRAISLASDPPPKCRSSLWKTWDLVNLQGRLCRIFGRSRKEIN
ncbi:hypothetical protein Prudu_1448S000100, partial [Prunus dulcis]